MVHISISDRIKGGFHTILTRYAKEVFPTSLSPTSKILQRSCLLDQKNLGIVVMSGGVERGITGKGDVTPHGYRITHTLHLKHQLPVNARTLNSM